MKGIKSEPIKTVLTITVCFMILHVITKQPWMLVVAIATGIIGISSNYLSKKIDFLWMKLTFVLSLIVPNVLLTVIFYSFLFPIAIISRGFRKKDPLSLKNSSDSLFTDVDKKFEASSFNDPW